MNGSRGVRGVAARPARAERVRRTGPTASPWIVSIGCAWPLMVPWAPAGATEPSCPAENRMTVDFDNGAGWQLCWTSRRLENIVLSDVRFRARTTARQRG